MHILHTALAWLNAAYWLLVLLETVRAMRYMLRLPASGELAEYPLVSVIIAAKEEQQAIAETIRRLRGQSYPHLEIIAVNDRSEDATGRILDELYDASRRPGREEPPLEVIHIGSLPEGWLGKNHALYQGYLKARGEYLLFTDADVSFGEHAVRDAVAFMRREQADHLTLSPDIKARGFWLTAFVRYFFFAFSLYIRPWRANADEDRKHGMGIGAFNMLSRQAYEAIGTHKAIAMRPDDDLQLGLCIKSAGLRQRLASASNCLEVEWYASLSEAVKGLEKNVFSGFQYRFWLAGLAVAGQLALFVGPWIGMWMYGGLGSMLFGFSSLLMAVLYAVHIRSLTGSVGPELMALPLAALLLTYVVFRSVFLTLRRNGIYWRGTFYPLDLLKKMTRR
ncbi:glycosyltransferase [Paenibacillus thalictri]|uniref:4,4'-diaponeurosporenoate glycosyltransferase n=1 Tax=Paenibacillus thalictri TaxID=2527873 RepID=A0A4Q9DXC1_9BACL|nr:glycosyltransferase family 2 protein [Paenibacillus thalictri]TBL80700.1 glycosyltransferase [Paenibacillus thalictri]